MGDFYSDLKSALGRRMLWEVVLGVRRNDLLGLAGQLAYFFLLFFFPLSLWPSTCSTTWPPTQSWGSPP